MRSAHRKIILAALAWAASALSAHAQSSPGWSYGFVPTPAQWNAAFAAKQDYAGSAFLPLAGGTMVGRLTTATPNTSGAGFNLPQGAAPSAPNNGDMWTTSAGLFARINGVTFNLTGGGAGLAIGTTPISGGTTGRVLCDNAGILCEYSITGSAGSVVMSAGPTLTGTTTVATLAASTITWSTTLTGTSSNAAALAIGPNGATNPAFQVDASTGSLASGWKVTGSVTGGGTSLSIIDSGANSSGSINSKGIGVLNLNTVGTTGYVNVGTQLVIGGTPAEADPLWVGGTLAADNIGAGKFSGTFSGTRTHTAIIWIEPSFGATANITDWGGLRINDASTTPGYALDAQYQLRIQKPTKGVINHAIYTEGTGVVSFGDSNCKAHLCVNDNTVSGLTPPSGTSLYYVGAANGTVGSAFDSFGVSGVNQIVWRRSDGTSASPNTAIAANSFIGQLAGQGNDGVGYSFVQVSLSFNAGSLWTNTNHETDIRLSTTPNGSTTIRESARLYGSGGLSMAVAGTALADPGNGGIAAALLTSTGAIKSSSATAGLGYLTGAGAGGTSTQTTNRTTAYPAINKITGLLTPVSAAGAAFQCANVPNTTIAATDTVVLTQISASTDRYFASVKNVVAATGFDFCLNDMTGTTVEQPTFQFTIIKGSQN